MASADSVSRRPRAMSDTSAAYATSPIIRHDSPQQETEVKSPSLAKAAAIQRAAPRMNQDDLYICDVSADCAGLTFHRKCEWSKHMDRHDRPYRCKDPTCAKLQGFTYSGGLLRHEREVHDKHGGPKEKLRCPFPECKRHDGHGFTRKENLTEHIRRVHKKRSDLTVKPEADPAPWSAVKPPSQPIPIPSMSLATKRKWGDLLSPEPSDGEELHHEIKRLQCQNDQLQEQMDKLRGELEAVRAITRPMATVSFRSV